MDFLLKPSTSLNSRPFLFPSIPFPFIFGLNTLELAVRRPPVLAVSPMNCLLPLEIEDMASSCRSGGGSHHALGRRACVLVVVREWRSSKGFEGDGCALLWIWSVETEDSASALVLAMEGRQRGRVVASLLVEVAAEDYLSCRPVDRECRSMDLLCRSYRGASAGVSVGWRWEGARSNDVKGSGLRRGGEAVCGLARNMELGAPSPELRVAGVEDGGVAAVGVPGSGVM